MYAHFIGIEGNGMSAIARILLSAGVSISGSDLNPGILSQALLQQGAVISRGHRSTNLSVDVDMVVASAAIPSTNPEMQEARRRKLPIVSYAELLGRLMKEKMGIAIAGTHGKSTTSGLFAYLLQQADVDPSFVVGAKVRQLGGNAYHGSGNYFVAEACEYNRSFLQLAPHHAIITNIEADHLDYYRDLQDIISAFRAFAAQIPHHGKLVVEYQAAQYLGSDGLDCSLQTYGIERPANWQAHNIKRDKTCYRFDVSHDGRWIGQFATALPGLHNIANSLAAIALALEIGIDCQVVQRAIESYRGVARRFEIMASAPVTVIDDYAHHPTEIKAALQALRSCMAVNTVWAVFQPHQASRTYQLLDDFAGAFSLADNIIITDIFTLEMMPQLGAKSARSIWSPLFVLVAKTLFI